MIAQANPPTQGRNQYSESSVVPDNAALPAQTLRDIRRAHARVSDEEFVARTEAAIETGKRLHGRRPSQDRASKKG